VGCGIIWVKKQQQQRRIISRASGKRRGLWGGKRGGVCPQVGGQKKLGKFPNFGGGECGGEETVAAEKKWWWDFVGQIGKGRWVSGGLEKEMGNSVHPDKQQNFLPSLGLSSRWQLGLG